MANLSITAADVAVIEAIEMITAPEEETLSPGQYARYNVTNGTFEKGNGSDAAESRKGGLVVKREGDGMVTVLRKGIVDLGNALTSEAYDKDVFLSDTDGRLAQSAGSVTLVVGTVVPIWSNPSAVPDKALRIDL